MTKGELPMVPKEPDGPYTGHKSSGLMGQDALKLVATIGYTIQSDNKAHMDSEYDIQNDHNKHSFCVSDEINNNNVEASQINIAEYVRNLSDSRVRKTLARILSTDEPDENLDIENMEHYLLVAKRTNLLNTLKCCENKLICNLNAENCQSYYKLAENYELKHLQAAAISFIENNFAVNISGVCNNLPFQLSSVCNNQTDIQSQRSLCGKTKKDYKSYYSLFTCGTCGSKRTITTLVYDSNIKKKCYRNIKKGDKISKQFQCCCIQTDENNAPMVYWSFGKSVYQYDPLMNKCKKRASLYCKRANFSMISNDEHCFVIGGVYMSRKVLEIEEYNEKRDSWKKVAYLPGDALPIDPSCVVCNGLIFIFSAILDIEGNIKPRATAVYVFNPRTKTVKQLAEIPFSFNQMKTCVVDSFIYIASDKKHFIRFSPSDGSHLVLPEQILECKDFGMFTVEKSVILAGGVCRGGECNNIVRVFCTVSGLWETLSEKLPDSMAIYGACEVKIPNSAGTIVPFYETNVFEKR